MRLIPLDASALPVAVAAWARLPRLPRIWITPSTITVMAQHFALLVAGVCSSQVHMMNGTRLWLHAVCTASQPAQDHKGRFSSPAGMSRNLPDIAIQASRDKNTRVPG